MIIKKTYHFYAAHRNKGAGEKCGRIHGHTYDVVLHFKYQPSDIDSNGVTCLFSDLDAGAEPIIKEYDHKFLLAEWDDLCGMLDLANEPYESLPFETSCENLAMWLATRIKNETGLPLTRIELAETKSSTVIYDTSNL
jgi:6-pyruvoyl-tetrahydropterin synthase